MNNRISKLEVSKVLRVNDLLWRCMFYDELITTPFYTLCFSSIYEYKFMNCALNINFNDDLLFEKELINIENFFKKRKRVSSIYLTNLDVKNERLMQVLHKHKYIIDTEEEAVAFQLNFKDFKRQSVTKALKIEEVRTEEQLANYLISAISGYSSFNYTAFASSISKLYLTHLDGITQLHFVGYMDDKPVASASVGVCCGIAVLINASVIPEYRGLGINTSMIQKRILEAHKIGANRFYYITEPDNVGSIKSGAKVGFREAFRQVMYSKNT